MLDAGHLERVGAGDDERLRCTPAGLELLDELLGALVPPLAV